MQQALQYQKNMSLTPKNNYNENNKTFSPPGGNDTAAADRFKSAVKADVIKNFIIPIFEFEFEEIKMWELNSYPDGKPLNVICD